MGEFLVEHGVAADTDVLVRHVQRLRGNGHAFSNHDCVVKLHDFVFAK